MHPGKGVPTFKKKKKSGLWVGLKPHFKDIRKLSKIFCVCILWFKWLSVLRPVYHWLWLDANKYDLLFYSLFLNLHLFDSSSFFVCRYENKSVHAEKREEFMNEFFLWAKGKVWVSNNKLSQLNWIRKDTLLQKEITISY